MSVFLFQYRGSRDNWICPGAFSSMEKLNAYENSLKCAGKHLEQVHIQQVKLDPEFRQ